jgi:ketosteroid isomerase-like protein
MEVAQIERLELQLMTALQERDLATLEGLLGDDFTLTTGRPGAEVRSREEWLRISAGEYVVHDFEFEELVVQSYEGCAVARSRYRQRAEMAGQRREGAYRMTDVWIETADG